MSGRTFVRRRGTTVVPNSTVHDHDISFPALGVLTFLLSRPEEAPQGYRALLGRGLGQKAILNIFEELHKAGYRHQLKHRESDGRVVTHTVVSEEPISDETARNYMREKLSDRANRADTGSARSDLRKQGEPAGRTVRDVPSPGPPGLGRAPHIPSVSKGSSTHFVREEPGDSKGDADPQAPPTCEHGARLGLNAAGVPWCPHCRARLISAGGGHRD